MNRLPILLLAGVLLAACATPDSAALEARLDPATHGLSGAEISALAVDLATGEVLASRVPDRLLHPASTMKLVTAAALLAAGPLPPLVTRLHAGRIPGSETPVLVLEGEGDALLSSQDLEDLAKGWPDDLGTPARAFARADAFTGPALGEGWMWDDRFEAFQPPIAALSVDGACTAFVVEPGNADVSVRADDGAFPYLLDAAVDASPTDDRLVLDLREGPAGPVLVIRGKASKRSRERLPVPDPPSHALRTLLLRRFGGAASEIGIGRGPAPTESRVLARHERPVLELLRHTLKTSDNLGAECLLRHLARASGAGIGSAEAGLGRVRAYLDQLPGPSLRHHLVDGSGVSHYGLVSAELLVRVLVDIAADARRYETLREALPCAGRDGTLQRRLRGTAAEGRVFAKTGTLRGVSTLAGYVHAESGRRLAFAILVQNFVDGPARARAAQDAFVLALVGR